MGVISGFVSIVTLLMTPLTATHDPPSTVSALQDLCMTAQCLAKLGGKGKAHNCETLGF